MTYTPVHEAEVLQAYRANPRRFSHFKASKSVGIPLSDVFEIVNRNREVMNSTAERFGGFGRPEWVDFTVARRRILSETWDNTDEKISKARQDYEAGTHLMCTGRDGIWQILYSKPRNGKPDPQPNYFSMEKA